jgi:hypothetical protein
MADKYVLPEPSPVCSGFDNINVYEIEINLSALDEESKYIIVPGDVGEIVVTVEAKLNARGTIFTTTDLFKKVTEDDPDLTWVEWDAGEVRTVQQDFCPKVTALKVVQTFLGDPGTIKATMRFQ